MRKGIAVSPGVAIGTAYCIHEIFVNPDTKRLEDREVTAELARYETARDQSAEDLRALRQKVAAQVGPDEAAIFAVHESILRDAAFTKRIRSWIVEERLTASAALHRLMKQYTSMFARTKDEYMRNRVSDVRDVIIRISSHLSDVLQPSSPVLKGPLIVIADELLPSHVVALGNVEVKGIVTQSGSQTSHAAILARSRGIPAVAGVPTVLRQVKTGDRVIVDGREGHVLVNPDSETQRAFAKLEREYFHLRDHLAENRDHPARLADDVPIELLANINNPADAGIAVSMGATGVGLYRTEYLYLAHPDVPDEDEQLEVYKRIIKESPEHCVTIRTLDIGGDKTIPYLGHTHQESNPFLGWRSIRLSFEHPEFFRTQLRAVLRAAGEIGKRAKVRLMFPMITTLEEIHRVRNMVRTAQKQLTKRGCRYSMVPLGMMLEVPAAAISIDAMLDAVDFVSIGSNDLIQYLMAADRDNPKVSHLCQPLAPAVLKTLDNVIRSCNRAKKPLTLCGEMAGQPRAFVLLVGMGLRSFSMSPAFVPSIKELALHITVKQAEEILGHALKLKTTGNVKRYMDERLKEIAPDLVILETV